MTQTSIHYHTIPSESLQGEITVPGDKSISHRALLCSAIAQGKSSIRNCCLGSDVLATLAALRAMDVNIIQQSESCFIVEGAGLKGLNQPDAPLDMGNSGTGMRLLAGILVGQAFDSVLCGDESLSRRPMERIARPLLAMGAKLIMSVDETAPLFIYRATSLHGIEYTLPVASAQVKSCALLAGLYAEGETVVIEPKQTRDHTERMLQSFAYPIHIEANRIALSGGGVLTATDIDVPGDISSAAFLIVAATITPGSEIVLKSVGVNPTRLGVINIMREMGADIEVSNHRLEGHEPVADICVCYARLRGIEIPAEQIPSAIDEFPVIFIAAACAQGKTVLRGAQELRVKESDRILAMATGLRNLGVEVKALPDGIIINGGSLGAGEVDSAGDHRVAMAFAIAGCVASGEIRVHNCGNVETSFPNFVALSHQLGIQIEESEVGR